MTHDDSTTARIITLALSRPTFTVNEALAHVRWGTGRRSEMLVLLEHLANAKSDVLQPVAGDRYAATATIRRMRPRSPYAPAEGNRP
jgi:hypothetical protein